MKDSYEALINDYLPQENFFAYGLENTIYIPDEKVKPEWEKLKKQINSNKKTYMRGLKDHTGNQLFFDFYGKVFKNEQVAKDPSNTQTPAKIIETLTGYKKSKDLRNYQLASIFGRGKNIFAFSAPWNIAYIPSIFDPLLNSEVSTDLATAYKQAFLQHSYTKFKPYIDEFNDMITNRHFLQSMDDYFARLYDNNMLDRTATAKFETLLREDFIPIAIH